MPQPAHLGRVPIVPFLTVPQIAKALAVNRDTVLGWIHAGELVAHDVARKGARRRTWRVREADLESFLPARKAPEPPARRRRARKQGDYL